MAGCAIHRALAWPRLGVADYYGRIVITIVSGLPRSGTSLMMQMLAAGGMPLLTDLERKPDIDNPRG